VICSFVAGRPGWAISVVSYTQAASTNTGQNSSIYF
jgi:hypothetical protein